MIEKIITEVIQTLETLYIYSYIIHNIYLKNCLDRLNKIVGI